MSNQVNDLRSALELLRGMPGQLVETEVPVDPAAELSGVYRHVGAGGTVARPTREGPAMLFRGVKGHPDAQVVIGVLASRKRAAALLDCPAERLGWKLRECVSHPVQPVQTAEAEPPCQEVVHLASEPGFNLNKLVPAPTNTPDDAGPYITMGMCYATHPDTGASDITIHRLCIQ
ncbi:MAG: UbiD family decarboxylase domain-containing protein, partial [Oscillospiraceae bacterium]